MPPKPYQLSLLGPWELTDPDGNSVLSVLAQPKRLCLLAFLALRAEPTTRASVVALFWPDSDEVRGRNALNQAVFYLRRSLGPGVIENVEGDRLCVSAAALSFDVREALSDGPPETLRCQSTFFEGWNADDSQPLQEWIDGVRRRVDQLAVSPVENSVAEGTPTGSHPLGGESDPPEEGIPVEPGSDRDTRVPRSTIVWRYLALAMTVVAIAAMFTALRSSAPASGTAPPEIVVLMPRLMSVDPEYRLREEAVHAEMVNRLAEVLGAGRIVAVPFARALPELERILAVQTEEDVPHMVIETTVRVTGADVRLTATLIDRAGSGAVQSTISGDFVLENDAAGLIQVPRAIAEAVAARFAPLVASPVG